MANNISATEKQAKALALRKAGVSYVGIAEALGYSSGSGAFKAVSAGLKKTLQEPADELRKLELARLDDMLKAIASHVSAGSLTAIDRAIKIQERRAKLLGLDAPSRQDVTSGGEKLSAPIGVIAVDYRTGLADLAPRSIQDRDAPGENQNTSDG
jgi:hypothetical protein